MFVKCRPKIKAEPIEKSLVTVNENDSKLNVLTNYTYRYAIYLSDKWYAYASNSPFYITIKNGLYWFLFADDVTRNNGTISKTKEAVIDGVQYYNEGRGRDAETLATAVSNYKILEWSE